MNKYYVIIPAALLLAFLGFERDFQRKRAAEDRVRAEIAAQAHHAEETARQQQQVAAQRDAEKRAAERQQQEHDRVEKKRRDYDAMMATLRAQDESQAAELAQISAEVTRLSAELKDRRAKQQESEREAFELARTIELRRIDRRNAELEIQRTTAMVAARLDEIGWPPP